MYDAIVIGGGPAGVAATTWLARYRRRVLLVDAGEPRNRWADAAHGYLGFDPVDPAILRQRAHRDLSAYPTAVRVIGKATRAGALHDGGFEGMVDGDSLRTRRLVLTTGVADEFPDVEGCFEHYGADVFHCPSCDGYQAQDRPVVAFGWSAHGAAGLPPCLLLLRPPPCQGSGRWPRLRHRRRRLRHGRRARPHERARGVRRRRPHARFHLVQVAAADGAVAGTGCALSLRGGPGAPDAPAPGPDVERELDGG